MPLCRGSHFDLSHYIALDGVSNFVASGEDLAPGGGPSDGAAVRARMATTMVRHGGVATGPSPFGRC